jgi:hypothetical protein
MFEEEILKTIRTQAFYDDIDIIDMASEKDAIVLSRKVFCSHEVRGRDGYIEKIGYKRFLLCKYVVEFGYGEIISIKMNTELCEHEDYKTAVMLEGRLLNAKT